MIRRIRLVLLIARPPVLLLLALFAALGVARAGHAADPVPLARALAVVFGYLLFSVACNDLADEAIDRVNLPGDKRRPLVAGTANRRELAVAGLAAAVVAVAVSATVSWVAVAVTLGGLLVSANYSLRPVRLADRGALASLVLPACYVAVPYLLGILAVRPSVRRGDLLLLAGLYVGFIGRILLKDFRDVRGDALFGKRTFLVRYGRRWTCLASACLLVPGSVALVLAAGPTPALAAATAGYALLCLALLGALSKEAGHHRDDALISAIAIAGRGTMVTLLAHLGMTGSDWSAPRYDAVILLLVAVTGVQAAVMARRARIHKRPSPTRAAPGAGSRPPVPARHVAPASW